MGIYLLLLLLLLYYLFLRCREGGKIIIQIHARVCFYFNAVVSISKFSSLSHASLKSYLIMRLKTGWHGMVLPRAAVELSPALCRKDEDDDPDSLSPY